MPFFLLLAVPAWSGVALPRVVRAAPPAAVVRPVALSAAMPSGAVHAPLLQAPSLSFAPSLAPAPAVSVAAPAAAAASVSARAAAVAALLESPALRPDAPAEDGRSGGDALMAALTGEEAVKAEDGAVVPFAAAADAPAPAPLPPPSPKKPGEFKRRAVTGAVLVAGQLALIHWGGLAFSGFVVLVCFQMLRELAVMLKAGGRPVQARNLVLTGTLAAMAVAAGLPAAPILGAAAAWVLLREMATLRSPDRAAWTVFGAALLGVLPAFLALVRGLSPHGEALTMMVFAAAWALDTGAYAVGKAFGRRKLAPAVSPGKTWEGAVGGFLAAAAVVGGFAAAVPGLLTGPAAMGVILVLGALGQVSGLSNSMLKRALGVKDSGTLLPGHGGVLDRFDTFVLTAALLYALLG